MVLEGKLTLYYPKIETGKLVAKGSTRVIGSPMYGKPHAYHTFTKDGVKVDITNKLYLLQEFERDCYLGEIEIFNRQRRTHYAIANKDTHVMVLSRLDLEDVIIQEFPHVCADLKRVSETRLNVQIEMINEIEKLIYKVENKAAENKETGERLETSFNLNGGIERLQERSEQSMYLQSLDSFPIEDLIEETAALRKDIRFAVLRDQNLDVLIKMFNGNGRVI